MFHKYFLSLYMIIIESAKVMFFPELKGVTLKTLVFIFTIISVLRAHIHTKVTEVCYILLIIGTMKGKIM